MTRIRADGMSTEYTEGHGIRIVAHETHEITRKADGKCYRPLREQRELFLGWHGCARIKLARNGCFAWLSMTEISVRYPPLAHARVYRTFRIHGRDARATHLRRGPVGDRAYNATPVARRNEAADLGSAASVKKRRRSPDAADQLALASALGSSSGSSAPSGSVILSFLKRARPVPAGIK